MQLDEQLGRATPAGSSACDPETLFGDALDLQRRAGAEEALGDPVGVGAASEVGERNLQATSSSSARALFGIASRPRSLRRPVSTR